MKNYFFDSNGLRFSHRFLESMWPKVKQLPIEEQSEFVDAVTHRHVSNGVALVSPADLAAITSNKNINTTSVGNIAYIALYHPNEMQRATATTLLNMLRK